MTIGFRKHEYFYDRVLSRTVIARSEATWQSVSQTLQIPECFRKIGLYRGNGLSEGELPHKEEYGLPHQSADWFAMTYENGSWVRGKRGHPGVRQCAHWLAHPLADGRPRAQPSEARLFARRNDSVF